MICVVCFYIYVDIRMISFFNFFIDFRKSWVFYQINYANYEYNHKKNVLYYTETMNKFPFLEMRFFCVECRPFVLIKETSIFDFPCSMKKLGLTTDNTRNNMPYLICPVSRFTQCTSRRFDSRKWWLCFNFYVYYLEGCGKGQIRGHSQLCSYVLINGSLDRHHLVGYLAESLRK